MPELPEVETIRRGLEDHIVGRRVSCVHIGHPRPVRQHPTGPDGFRHDLTGRSFAVPRRRGKYLWLPFVDGDALVVQLRMSGQFRIDAVGTPPPRHTRITFVLDNDTELRYVDQRMLGGMVMSPGGAALPNEIAHVARDPFEPEYDLDAVVREAARRRSPIKSVLLNQRIVSGIGNIYADESLWRACVHFGIPSVSLEPEEIERVLRQAATVMGEALVRGGTSFDGLYVNVNGSSGYFSRDLDVYGRQGLPCRRCGATVRRERFANRGSHYCPQCQPAR